MPNNQRILEDIAEQNPRSQEDIAAFLHVLGAAFFMTAVQRFGEDVIVQALWDPDGFMKQMREG